MRTFRTDRILPSGLLRLACALALIAAQASPAAAQARSVTVQVDRPGAAVPRTLFGLFFEDINFGADGGLYPERLKNRSFEFPEPLMGWKPAAPGDSKGVLQVYDRVGERDTPNSHYLRIKVDEPGKGFGATNEGFRGVGVEEGAEYTVSVRARRSPARSRCLPASSATRCRLIRSPSCAFAGERNRRRSAGIP